MNLDGGFYQIGTGEVTAAGNITARDSISFSAPVTLTGNVSLDTSAGSGSITFNNSVNGAHNLTLAAGTGNITFNSPLGAGTRLGDLTVVSAGDLLSEAITANRIRQLSGTGTSIFNGALDTPLNGGSDLTGANFIFNIPLTLTDNLSLDTSASNGNITFNSTADGARNLTLNAGTGTITFNGAVGGISTS